MNYMDMVAEMLDVKMGEEFKIVDAEGKPRKCIIFKLTENGLKSIAIKPNGDYFGGWSGDPDALSLLLTGKYSIVRKPWKPKKGETYYTISAISDNEIIIYYYEWRDTSACYEHYALSNCFRTEEEAKQHASKYIEWLKNKEPDTSWRD